MKVQSLSKLFVAGACLAFLTLVFFGCPDSSPTPAPSGTDTGTGTDVGEGLDVTDEIPITNIELIPASFEMDSDAVPIRLEMTVTPDDTTTTEFDVSSSPSGIVEIIYEDGLIWVSPVGRGEAEITVTARDNNQVSATAAVTVLSIDNSLIDLKVNDIDASGTSPNFTATVVNNTATVTFTLPEEASAQYRVGTSGEYTPTDGSITVSNISVGNPRTVYIRIISESGRQAEYTLSITRATTLINNITLSPASLTLTADGDAGIITAAVSPANPTNGDLEWSSSDDTVATVAGIGNTATVTPLAGGTAIIRAAAKDGSGKYGEITVTVEQPVNDVEINLVWDTDGHKLLAEQDEIEIAQGGTATINAPPGENSYQWYVGGRAVFGETESSFLFDSTKYIGTTFNIGLLINGLYGDAVTVNVR